MRVEVKSYYGLARSFDQTEYYETAHHKQLINGIKDAIGEGRMMAVCGVVGSGKTVMMRRLQQMLKDEKNIIVSRALSVEKSRIVLPALISALFYDLSPDKKVQIPRGEARERELLALMKRRRRPVALFIDEAHDLSSNTLTELKRLTEMAEDGGIKLSVVLAGHPRLRNDLLRPTMEEIGYRTRIFILDGITGSQREYISWLMSACMEKGDAEDILTAEASDILASKLRTPLQIQQHLELAFEAGFQAGIKPVTGAVIDSVMSRQLDDLEPLLRRHGYKMKDIVEQFGATPAEIRALFSHQLEAIRTTEIREKILAVGLPI
ncbi:ExeA family protein [Salmonella enterica]|nr:AAA family ATPase [Salmonella enterica]EIM0323169.1 ExeA family protein [Salmonella enterica]EIR3069228.1 ExeA family protein [Salmonella enterica]